jgi:hypothetical protein
MGLQTPPIQDLTVLHKLRSAFCLTAAISLLLFFCGCSSLARLPSTLTRAVMQLPSTAANAVNSVAALPGKL